MRAVRVVSLLLSIAWLSPDADAASVKRLRALWNAGSVSVSFDLDGVFDDETIRGALQSGLPTGFTYHVELIRKRPNWFDDTLDTKTIEVVATVNAVTREYLLNYRRDRRLVRSETFDDLKSLQRRMSSIAEEALFEQVKAHPSKLRVRVRADLLRGYLLYVIPYDVSTKWAETRVRRQNAVATTPAGTPTQPRKR